MARHAPRSKRPGNEKRIDSFCDSALRNLDETGATEDANMDLDQEIALIDRFLGDALRQIMKDK